MPRRNPHVLFRGHSNLNVSKELVCEKKGAMAALQAGPAAPFAAARCPAHCRQSPVPHWRKQNYSPFKRRTLLSMLSLFLPKSNSQLPAGWISLSLMSQRSCVCKFSYDDSWKTEMLRLLSVTVNSSYRRRICRSRCFSHQGSVVLRSSYGADIWKDLSIPLITHGSHIHFRPPPDLHLTMLNGCLVQKSSLLPIPHVRLKHCPWNKPPLSTGFP